MHHNDEPNLNVIVTEIPYFMQTYRKKHNCKKCRVIFYNYEPKKPVIIT